MIGSGPLPVSAQPAIRADECYDNRLPFMTAISSLSASARDNCECTQTGVHAREQNWQSELTSPPAQFWLCCRRRIPCAHEHPHRLQQHVYGRSGELAGLQVLLPGETVTPGVNPGKKGNALTQTAGNAFNITVRAVDAFWNIIAENTDSLSIGVSDTFAQIPADIQWRTGDPKNSGDRWRSLERTTFRRNSFATSFPAAIADSLINRAERLFATAGVAPGRIAAARRAKTIR
ncbi:MAG: hypothetical protein R3C26_21190 [Calditrichia bacterium]